MTLEFGQVEENFCAQLMCQSLLPAVNLIRLVLVSSIYNGLWP